MTEMDARIGRKIMVDELNTINAYESMADNADDPKVAEVVRDIADEEKVHTGEGAAIVAENDPRAEPAMKEGLEEVGEIAKATRQATFENGDVVVKKPKEERSVEDLLRTPGYFDNSRWASLSEDQKKRIDYDRWKREYDKHTKKSVGPSFAEMFADERGRVLEKTGMMTDEALEQFKTQTISKDKGLFAQAKELKEKAEKEKAIQDEGIQHKKQTVRGSFENLNQIQLKPNEKEGYHITADNKPSNYPKAEEDEGARKKREDFINRMRVAYGGGKQ